MKPKNLSRILSFLFLHLGKRTSRQYFKTSERMRRGV